MSCVCIGGDRGVVGPPQSASPQHAGKPVPQQPAPGAVEAAAGWPGEALLLDAMCAAVIVTDLGGTVLYANPAVEQLYGHRRAVLVGANVLDLLVGPVDRQWAEQIMAQVAAGQPWTGEFDVPHADGSTRTVRITDSPVWRDGAVVAVVGVVEDITQSRVVHAATARLGGRPAQLARAT